MRDVIGIRVVFYFSDDIDIIYNYFKKKFQPIEETIDKLEKTQFAPTRVNLVF
ncbi:MAG: hypothetical protein IPK03_14990 [Bacteroidetes bacterium]|nr:hypothetical protein [Bacteroidota bacterium]